MYAEKLFKYEKGYFIHKYWFCCNFLAFLEGETLYIGKSEAICFIIWFHFMKKMLRPTKLKHKECILLQAGSVTIENDQCV